MLRQTLTNHSHLCLRLAHCHIRFEPPDHAPGIYFRGHLLRRPELGLFVWKVKALRHDPDDLPGVHRVEPQSFADDIRIAAKTPAPESMTQHNDSLAALILFGRK